VVWSKSELLISGSGVRVSNGPPPSKLWGRRTLSDQALSQIVQLKSCSDCIVTEVYRPPTKFFRTKVGAPNQAGRIRYVRIVDEWEARRESTS